MNEPKPTGNKVVDLYKRKMDPVRPHLQKALEEGDPQKIMESLTGKQLAFCEEYLKDLNASQACLRAGYQTNHANRVANELLRNPGVRFTIDYLKTVRAENSDVTSDYVLKKILKIVESTETRNPQAALRGLELLGKHLAMFKDRTEISGPDGEAIQYQKVQEDAADFTGAIARLAKRNGAGRMDDVINTGTEG